jgi:hypothetical protein
MRKLMLAAAIAALPFSAIAADDDLVGTYKLVSEQRKIVDTGEIVSMPDSLGYISYGKDGRMLVLIVRSGRPKPESVEKLTDQQRADLFRTMISYGGTYKFDGNKVEHHVDISWNEVWTGTTVIRDFKKEGDKLVYTTRPAPSPVDGKMSVVTVVWEKVK